MILEDGQYELGGLVLGAGTAYRVMRFEDDLGVRPGDAEAAYDDGVRFGEDLFDGMVCTLEGMVETAPGVPAWDAVRALRRVWRGDDVRRTPGAVTTLRRKVPGMPTRRVYGRPRKCTPVMSRGSGVGLVPVVADFQCADDKVYDDVQVVEVLPILPASTGGIVTVPGGGIVSPITTAAATERPGILTHVGDVDTWPVATIRGPVTNPALEYRVGGSTVWLWEFAGTLAEGQSVTVDARPWARTVLRDNGASWSGKRTRASTPLRTSTIPPGQGTILFRGTSAEGTAQAEVAFEAAYAAA